MKIRLLAIFLLFISQTVNSQTLNSKAFSKEATRLGMQFIMPAGYLIKKTVPNRDLHYSFAITNPDSTIDVRYSLFPLKPLLKKYKTDKKFKKVTINPDSIYFGLMKANGMSMTNGAIPDIKEIPLEKAVKFNADFAVTHSFEFICEFGKGYKYGQFICLHKKSVADIIITFMSNKIDTFEDLIVAPFYSLTFR